MDLLKLLIFTLTFYEAIVDLDAKICPKGQRVTKDKGCEACRTGYFQPEENDSQKCKVCTKCDTRFGSMVTQCTTVTDTKCKCNGGFVPWVNDPASCKCPIGFGLKQAVCSKCEHGYFNKKINSPCQKWKECKSGVIANGTDTSDATCNEERKNNTAITSPPTSNKIASFITHLPQRPHEGAQTQKIYQRNITTTTTTTTTTMTAAPPHVTSKNLVHSDHPSDTGNHIGMTLLIFGIVGLLVLTAVICKLHINPCVQRKPAVQTNDLLCSSPVEESGDDSLSSFKLNPGEP